MKSRRGEENDGKDGEMKKEKHAVEEVLRASS
jgi:hypothetical protein